MKYKYGEVKKLCPTCCKELDISLFQNWPNCMICRNLRGIVDLTANPKKKRRRKR